MPQGIELPATARRSVLKSLYLLFNEGYNSSHPDKLIREDLCEEAMQAHLSSYSCIPVTNLLTGKCFVIFNVSPGITITGKN